MAVFLDKSRVSFSLDPGEANAFESVAAVKVRQNGAIRNGIGVYRIAQLTLAIIFQVSDVVSICQGEQRRRYTLVSRKYAGVCRRGIGICRKYAGVCRRGICICREGVGVSRKSAGIEKLEEFYKDRHFDVRDFNLHDFALLHSGCKHGAKVIGSGRENELMGSDHAH